MAKLSGGNPKKKAPAPEPKPSSGNRSPKVVAWQPGMEMAGRASKTATIQKSQVVSGETPQTPYSGSAVSHQDHPKNLDPDKYDAYGYRHRG